MTTSSPSYPGEPSTANNVARRDATGASSSFSHPSADTPTAELLRELSEQTSRLVRQEIDLARVELTVKAKRAGLGGGLLGAAGLLGFFSFAAMTAFAIAVIAIALPVWLSALIVGLLLGATAGLLALGGYKEVRRAAPAVPEQTVETAKEDLEWAKAQKRSVSR